MKDTEDIISHDYEMGNQEIIILYYFQENRKLRHDKFIRAKIEHLYDINVTKNVYPAQDTFYPQSCLQGACIDTGAVRSVYENQQARAHCRESGVTFNLKPSSATFRFQVIIYKSEGRLKIRIPGDHYGFIKFDVDFIPADAPLLIELQELEKEGLPLNYLDNVLEHKPYGYTLPITYKNGHIFIAWKTNNVFSRKQNYSVHIYIFALKY